MENKFREEVKNLLLPYLSEPGNADYLILKIEQIRDKYSDIKKEK